MFLGISLALLAFVARMERIEARMAVLNASLTELITAKPIAPTDLKPLPVEGMPTAPTVPSAPAAPVTSAASPSGVLKRGSLSPDGTKYAGYEETTKGKIGIAVETVSGGRVRYIVIFNPFTESTGAGAPSASEMSVRWVDNQTIEYDVLVTRNGNQTKETEQVRIFF
jgi:hypothetical protein